MQIRALLIATLAVMLLGSSAATAMAREQPKAAGANHAVFVQSNDPGANQVLTYRRAESGALTLAAAYPTGGRGGRLEGAVSDPLASQGSLVYDAEHRLLIGVNAGSDSVYAFSVDDARLSERQVVSSGGSFPVSLAVHGDLLYVLNAKGGGTVHGYRIAGGRLHPIENSTRGLGLIEPVNFLTSPGQVGFTPDGGQLIVTTKANGSHILVFGVRANGRLAESPVRNPSATPVPFAFLFDPSGHLVVGEAATSSVSTYTVTRQGTLMPIGSRSDGQVALCWIDRVGDLYFVSNTGSDTASSFRIDASGNPMLVATTPVGPGPVDLDHARGGEFIYIQLGGNGTVGVFGVNADGTLTPIGSVPTDNDQEGIVAI
jgi:6-phosphogluconolactonase (cycloisomerase 2 family)